jgi:hypothetical protein
VHGDDHPRAEPLDGHRRAGGIQVAGPERRAPAPHRQQRDVDDPNLIGPPIDVQPSDLFRRLSELGVVSAELFAIDWSQEKDAAWIEAQSERETQVFKTLRFLMEHEPSDLTVILVRAFGAVQSCYERDPQTRAACVDSFRALDSHLAGLAQPGANVLFVSEPHGGTATRTFFVNAWLAAAYALNGESERARGELEEAWKHGFRRNMAGLSDDPWYASPKVRALAEATYFVGLRKAGMPEG